MQWLQEQVEKLISLTHSSERVHTFRMRYPDSSPLFTSLLVWIFTWKLRASRQPLFYWLVAFNQVTQAAGLHLHTLSRPENLHIGRIPRCCWCCFGNQCRSLVLKFDCTLEPLGDIRNIDAWVSTLILNYRYWSMAWVWGFFKSSPSDSNKQQGLRTLF